MTQSDVNDLLAVMKMVSERAGKIILGYYVDEAGIEARSKDDASPVTDADEAAEEFILEALEQISGDMPVVAEEQVVAALNAAELVRTAGKLPAGYDPDKPFWLVDPLDGTKEFISKNGEFTVNIALIQDREPVAGVVHAPALDMMGRPWIWRRGPYQTRAIPLSPVAATARARSWRPSYPTRRSLTG